MMGQEERNWEIASRFCSGETLQSIASSYGITRERVRQILLKKGLTAKAGQGGKPRQMNERHDLVATMLDAGLTVNEIVKIAGIPEASVRNTMLRTGKKAGTLSERRGDRIVELRNQGMTQTEIAKALNTKQGAISYTLRRKLRISSQPGVDYQDEIIRRYQEGESTVSIADGLSMSPSGVAYVLHRNGIKLRPRGGWYPRRAKE